MPIRGQTIRKQDNSETCQYADKSFCGLANLWSCGRFAEMFYRKAGLFVDKLFEVIAEPFASLHEHRLLSCEQT